MRRISLVQFPVIAVLCGLAGLEYRHVFTTEDVLVPVTGAAALPVVLAVLARLPRRRPATLLTATLTVLGFVVFATNAVFGDTAVVVVPGVETFRAMGDGFVHGWARLLSVTLPAPPDPTMLLVPAALTWVAAYFASELADRSRHPLAPVPPVVLLYASALVFGVDGVTADRYTLGALAAGLALLIAIRGRSSHRVEEPDTVDEPMPTPAVAEREDDEEAFPGPAGARRRVPLAAVPVLVLVGVLSPIVGPRMPFANARDPFDPRDYTFASTNPSATVNPLTRIPALLADPDRVLFRVDAGRPEPWRLVVLDRYDGVTWTSSSEYDAAGNVLRAYAPTDTASTEVRQHIEIVDLDGPWLPAADRPVEVRGATVRFDRETGALISPDGEIDGLVYDVTSTVPETPLVELLDAEPGRGRALRRYRAFPEGLPEGIEDLAEDITRGSTFALQTALLIEEYLREQFTFNAAVTGHSYGHIRYFLTVSGEGSSEQFATAFAIMARSLGLPARVVVGFLPGKRGPATGSFQVTAGDAFAWPEVNFGRQGWVAFNPEPPRPAGTEVGAGVLGVSDAEARDEITLAAKRNAQLRGREMDADTEEKGGADGGIVKGLVPFVIAAGGAVVALGVLVPARRFARSRWRRLRRRRARNSSERILGAWLEVGRRLDRAGFDGLRAMTVDETASCIERSIGVDAADPLGAMGLLVNAALYDAYVSDETHADEAWRLERQFAAAFKQQVRDRPRSELEGAAIE